MSIGFTGATEQRWRQLHGALERFDMKPSDVGVELTEKFLITTAQVTREKLASLHARGCVVAVDGGWLAR